MTTASPPPPPPAPPTVPAQPCAGITVYLQIYGPDLRDHAEALRSHWRSLGATAPGVDDVWDSARRAGRTPPRPYGAPTVIQHSPLPPDCRAAFAPADEPWAWQYRPLAERFRGTARSGVVEVWLPTRTQMGADAVPRQAFCYQEHDPAAAAGAYGLHCHATAAACTNARGSNARREQGACRPTDLGALPAWPAWRRGFQDSWYLSGDQPFDAPYPPLR